LLIEQPFAFNQNIRCLIIAKKRLLKIKLGDCFIALNKYFIAIFLLCFKIACKAMYE
jgi:hypothetical protein